jgi:glycosyltransferase involved in cell wall biosynthesis
VREARRSGVQHLHAHFADGATRIAMLASMLTGLPYSFTTHARDIFRSGVDNELLREKIDGAGFVIGVSEYSKRFLQEEVRHARNGRVRVVYNGVDLDKFRPDPRRAPPAWCSPPGGWWKEGLRRSHRRVPAPAGARPDVSLRDRR